MSEQFISVITDEAMGRVCYDGGWNLKPWRFCVSETDVFKDYTGEIFDKQGNVTPEAFLYLKGITTEWLQDDYDTEHVWYQGNFSSLSQATPTTLTHHITIPGNVDVAGNTKDIKTIYFNNAEIVLRGKCGVDDLIDAIEGLVNPVAMTN